MLQPVGIIVLSAVWVPQQTAEELNRLFYIPHNPSYTIVDSVIDSLRFTVDKTLTRCDCGHLRSISSFVDPDGEIIGWHEFGKLEGPGWAANAVGGAYELYIWGGFLGKRQWQDKALGVLDHVLEHGFIEEKTGLIRGYRNTDSGKISANYKQNSDWFCPGSMAKVAYQLLVFADELKEDPRAARMRQAAVRCASWLDKNLKPVPNGWFPRRCTLTGEVVKTSPRKDDKPDEYWQRSGDGLFILQLQTALTQRGLADYTAKITENDESIRTLVEFAIAGIGGLVKVLSFALPTALTTSMIRAAWLR